MNAQPGLPGGASVERYVFPASFAQQRLWFIDQLEGTGSAWNVRLPVRLRGPLDIPRLERAVDEVVDRHESLRTTFGMRDGSIVQFVASSMHVPVERSKPEHPGEDALRVHVGQLAGHVFSLSDGPLFKVFLVEAGVDDHVLLLLAHHIISDAWSSGVLLRDLAAAYAAPLSLPALPLQYADFAVWQREWLAGPELERQVTFWRDHLAGAPAFIDLPVDRPRPRMQTFRGHRIGHALSAATTARLQQFAMGEGVTLFMLLFAAFNVLLSRWSGQADIVIGTPIAGRQRTELEDLVGFFANTLALRTRIDPAVTFRELLRAVRATALEAFAHPDLPFEKLVEVLKPPRSLAHSPVFQVLFVLQNTPWETTDFAGLAMEPADIAPADTARFDLSVSATMYEGRLWLGLEYATDLFEQVTIERLARGFEALLEAIVAAPVSAPDTIVGELPVQAPADLERQLHDWQPPATPVPELASLFESRDPSATAIECGDIRLTFGDLDSRVSALASRLKGAGVTADRPVALCLTRSPDMVVAMLATWRIGGHYLPLDPSHPPTRVAAVLDDSGARHLLVSEETAGRFPDFRGTVLYVAAEAGESVPPQVGATPVPADSPAYLIYTSGSTGRPKGVVVPRSAVANFLASMARTPGIAPGDRLLAVTTLAFDIAVLELLLPLTAGATTVIATEEEVQDPELLIAKLDSAAINVMQATPALWRNLLTAGWQGTPGLRLLCGGEALDRQLADRLLSLGTELWNLYGPTETTIWSTTGRVSAGEGTVSVGTPIANTRCYVLDANGRPLPAGARGDLWIGGAGVAIGYLHQPPGPDGPFQPDPFATGRMYRTGDRARWLSDGSLEIIGRSDFQLKLRGFRLEPGEIEAVLLAQPGIAAAVVVLREMAGDPRLVAYLVARDTPVADVELLQSLRAALPAYMIPGHFTWLAALPLTPNGKIDRAALPPPVPDTFGSRTEKVPDTALTAMEATVAQLFRELLGTPAGPDDDFFVHGGHSLLATRLVARLRADLRINVPLRAVFESPTVRGLAAVLEAAAPLPPTAAPAVVVPAPASGTTAPLSLVQQRLWFLDRLQPGNSAYHLAWAVELHGDLDRQSLQRALDGLEARHGSLRTRFVEVDGEPRQVVMPPRGLPLQLQSGDAAALAAGFARAPFNLAAGPPVRALLVEQGSALHTLVVVIHHIVADGWSLALLGRELSRDYGAARLGDTVPMTPPVRDYVDFAREQRRALAGGELARQLGYWERQLRGAPPFIQLPTDRPRAAVGSARGARLSRTLPVSLSSRLHELARGEACTFFVVLLAAFDVLLARAAGTEDVVVGTPIAGRPDTELESIVGFFVNTLVLRADLAGNPTVRELLARVRAMTLAAWEHAEVPFELLVETLKPPRSTNLTPLFQVLFNLHSEPSTPLEFEGVEVRPVAIERHTAKFDLGVSLTETAGGLVVHVEYSTDLFLESSIARFIEDYAVLLAGFADHPDARLGDLPYSARQSPGPLVQGGDDVCSGAGTLTEAFALQVHRQPDSLAVCAPATGNSRATDWTYADLAREGLP